MMAGHGLEAWLKGTIVLTCYANSTSQTQIIPSLISRLAKEQRTGERQHLAAGLQSARRRLRPHLLQTTTNGAYKSRVSDPKTRFVGGQFGAHCTWRGGVSRPGRGAIRGSCSALGLITVIRNSIARERGRVVVYPEHLCEGSVVLSALFRLFFGAEQGSKSKCPSGFSA